MCSERLRLIVDYRDTTRTYADSVRILTDLVGLSVESDAELLRRACKRAWDAAERARMSLFRHEADHGCDRTDFRATPAGGSPG